MIGKRTAIWKREEYEVKIRFKNFFNNIFVFIN